METILRTGGSFFEVSVHSENKANEILTSLVRIFLPIFNFPPIFTTF